MLIFDSKGNLKPYQPISSNVNNLKKFLIDGITSDSRKLNFEKYIKYSDDLKLLVKKQLEQWINGSFVTTKINPKDIDLVTFLDSETIRKLGSKLDPFRPPFSWERYGVDAYILEVYPTDSKLYRFSESDRLYWLDLFSHTRPNRQGIRNKKGFLEINY